jgi:predicted nucleic acid-binding protein
MPESRQIVTNTGPLLALVAGLGELEILNSLYERVVVPYEVCLEIMAGGPGSFGFYEFSKADFLIKRDKPTKIQSYLLNSLDLGESSVIQSALDEKIQTVCVDEAMGRRMARLNGLSLTGSLGIIIRAKKEGHPFVLRDAINQMQAHGIYLSERVIGFALNQAGE